MKSAELAAMWRSSERGHEKSENARWLTAKQRRRQQWREDAQHGRGMHGKGNRRAGRRVDGYARQSERNVQTGCRKGSAQS